MVERQFAQCQRFGTTRYGPDAGRDLQPPRRWLRPAATGFETKRLLKWLVRTTIIQTVMVSGGMTGLFWKVLAA